jgi:DNA (cytosine-5)-methyltransferase 1
MNLRTFTILSYRPLAVSLFAGVGGLDLGLEAAGFEIALAIERDPHAAAQYQINFPHTLVLCADIAQLSGEEIRNSIYSSPS